MPTNIPHTWTGCREDRGVCLGCYRRSVGCLKLRRRKMHLEQPETLGTVFTSQAERLSEKLHLIPQQRQQIVTESNRSEWIKRCSYHTPQSPKSFKDFADPRKILFRMFHPDTQQCGQLRSRNLLRSDVAPHFHARAIEINSALSQDESEDGDLAATRLPPPHVLKFFHEIAQHRKLAR